MMDWKKLLLAVPVLALSFAPAAEAKHKKDNNWQRYSDQRYRYRYNDNNRYNNGYRQLHLSTFFRSSNTNHHNSTR